MTSIFRFVITSLLVLNVVGCGSDDDAPAAATDRPQASDLNWSIVNYEQLSATPPQQCTEAEHFDISAEGTWEWKWCEDEKSGDLSASELNDLNNRIEAVRQAGFAPEVCMEISYTGRNVLDVTFRPNNKVRLHTLDRSGSCYRSESAKVDELERLVVDLKDRYTGFTTQPQ